MEKKLRQLIKEAMIAKKETGDSTRYQTFKNILEKAQKEAKDRLVDISDELIVLATKREIKQLEDALQYFSQDDIRYDTTSLSIQYAKELLPKMASNEQIKEFLICSNIGEKHGKMHESTKRRI